MTRPPAEPKARDRWLVAGVVLAVVGLLWILLGFMASYGGQAWGYDYLAYADAAERLADSGTLYQAETLDGPYRPGPYGLYMYAPPLGVAVTPLTSLPEPTAIAGWFVLHIAALALACALMPVRVGIRLATFGVAALSLAVTRDLMLGNVSVLLLLPLSAAWRWLDQPLGSIAQALAMSVRPTLCVLLIWQLLRRQWRALAWTVGAGVVLIVATLPFVGIAGYIDYLTVLRNLGGVSGVEFNYDPSSTMLALGASDALATVALLVGYAVAIGAMLLSLRRDREVGFMVAVSASLLLSPLLWDHYLAMLVLPAAFLAERGRAWALLLPLAAWLPPESYPVVVVVATLLPFLAREPRTPAVAEPMSCSTRGATAATASAS
jgi:hypothetical protein